MIESIKKILMVLVVLIPQLLLANVSVNSIFSDHMVVQRETEIPVWGWADANETVTVIGSWGVEIKTVANKDGTWRVNLKTPKSGGPYKITISGKNTLVIKRALKK